MDECKFCGCPSDSVTNEGEFVHYACGTDLHNSGAIRRGQLCEDLEELDRYRAMFPVPPWSTDEISADVCERLGVHRVRDGSESRLWPTYRTTAGVEVVVFLSPPILEVFHDGKYQRNCNTAGQLACLVAARKAAK